MKKSNFMLFALSAIQACTYAQTSLAATSKEEQIDAVELYFKEHPPRAWYWNLPMRKIHGEEYIGSTPASKIFSPQSFIEITISRPYREVFPNYEDFRKKIVGLNKAQKKTLQTLHANFAKEVKEQKRRGLTSNLTPEELQAFLLTIGHK